MSAGQFATNFSTNTVKQTVFETFEAPRLTDINDYDFVTVRES